MQWKEIENYFLSYFNSTHPVSGTKQKVYQTGVINDLLGQPSVQAGSDCRLILKFWDGRTLCVKIVITTGRDCGRPRGSISP